MAGWQPTLRFLAPPPLSAVTCATFSSDGKRILSGSEDRSLRLWEADSGEELRAFAGHENWVTAVAWSPDGTLALSASDDMTLKLWHVSRGREVDDLDLSRSTEFARCVAFAPDGRSFLAGTAGWVVLRFDLLPDHSK